MSENLLLKIGALENKIQPLDVERASLIQQLNHLKKLTEQNPSGSVTQYSTSIEKIQLFRNLFRGREDVYPKRWATLANVTLKKRQYFVRNGGIAEKN